MLASMMSSPDYTDDGLVLDDEGLTIRRYYSPWAGRKRISYRDLRGVQARPMTWLTGKGRLWGTLDPRYWLPFDLGRARKEVLLILDVGRRVSPVITPDDPHRVLDILQTRIRDSRG